MGNRDAPEWHDTAAQGSGCWHEGGLDAASLGHRPNVHDTLDVMAQVERSRKA
jgi:hypothetical protein